MSRARIGIDIGGTNLKAGLLNADGTLVLQHGLALKPEDKSEPGIVAAAVRAIDALCAKSGLDRPQLEGVGLGVAGVIEAERGLVTDSPNFPLWKNFPLAERLSAAAVLPVAIENDVNAVALGERAYGAAKGEDNFLCMAIGTGLGGALVLDGRLWRGVEGMAGEVGHLCVYPHGAICGCGARGCLETVASQSGLVRRIKEDNFRPVLDHIENESDIPRVLSDLSASGDGHARAYWEEVGTALGIALGGLLNTLNLKLVLFGGGLARAMPHFEPSMRVEMTAHAFPAVARGVEFRLGALWAEAGIYGGAALLDAGQARIFGQR